MYIIIIISNAIFLVLASPYLRTNVEINYPPEVNTTALKMQYLDVGNLTSELFMYITTRSFNTVIYVDLAVNSFLFLELLVRFLASPEKKRFIKSPMNVIDWISAILIIPGHISTFYISVLDMWDPELRYMYLMSSLTYSVRIMRMFRLSKYNEGMRLLLLSLSTCVNQLFMLCIAFWCFAFVFGTCIYMCELYGSQPFPDIIIATWWAVITMTTVGYGDFYPITIQGYVVGVICCLTGVVLIALPVAITSTNFYDYFTLNSYRLIHNEQQTELKEENIAMVLPQEPTSSADVLKDSSML